MIDLSRFRSSVEVFQFFQDEQVCRSFLEQQRWNGNVCCPSCGKTKIYRTNRGFRCADRKCDRKFSVTVGTIFENTKIKLRYWFTAIYLLTAHKKGISSHQLAKDLGISQKHAWFMLHRIRFALSHDRFTHTQDAIIESDTTFVGGIEANKHKSKRTANQLKRTDGRPIRINKKTPVIGIIERGGKVVAKSTSDAQSATIMPFIKENVKEGTTIMTDTDACFKPLTKQGYDHQKISHIGGEYVRGRIHTNTIENFWSHFKRGIDGIYHRISPKHMDRYISEYQFRFNSRGEKDIARFGRSLSLTTGRLTFKQLTEKPK